MKSGHSENGRKADLHVHAGLGYKELYACLEGECSLEEAVRIIKRDHQTFCQEAAYLV